MEPLNKEIRAFLEQHNQQLKNAPQQQPSVEALRAAFEQFSDQHAGPLVYVEKIEDIAIPALSSSGEIPIRIYTPEVGKVLPALLFFHGGGWQRGSIRSHDSVCRRFAVSSKCIVISVDWKLAPEHKYPEGLHDCFDVYLWLLNHGAIYNIDTQRLAVGGDSAGGNIAAGLVLKLKGCGQPLPKFQLLLYPALDLSCESKTYTDFAEGYFLSTERVKYYVSCYLSSPSLVKDPIVSPLKYQDLSGLPDTHIVTAGYDPLLDDGLAFWKKIKASGGVATYKCYGSMIHAFLHMTGTAPVVCDIISEISLRLSEGLLGA
eukprot:Colp12_sorted_trinity150504_noHs@11206